MNKILIIEDQPQMRKNLATMLQLEGYVVVTADNGRAGVELAKSQLPDLILCDVMMPELDGLGVLRELRAAPATAILPLIFLTAKGGMPDQRAGMNLGADDYLVKPASMEDILAAVRTRLARHLAHKASLASAQVGGRFRPNFDSAKPLERLGLTPREAEVLLWVAQGKSNGDVAIILGLAEKTVKKHLTSIFGKMGVESRNAATVQAFEILSA